MIKIEIQKIADWKEKSFYQKGKKNQKNKDQNWNKK